MTTGGTLGLGLGFYSGGNMDHRYLSGRGNADQHPIAAVTGLQGELTGNRGAANIGRSVLRFGLSPDSPMFCTRAEPLWNDNQGFSLATFASATNPTVALDFRGGVRMSFDSATPEQYGGVKIDGDWDLSATDAVVIDVGFVGTATLSRLEVFFCFDTGTTFTNYARYSTLVGGTPKYPRQEIPMLKSDFAITGVANWSSVKRVEIRLVKNTEAGKTTGYFFGVLGNVASRAKVMLSFDDGDATVYNEAFTNHMQAAGMPATCYVNGSTIGTAGKMTVADLLSLQGAGWDIGNHTFAHTPLAHAVSVTRSGAVATATFGNSFTHGLSPGDTVVISGFENSAYNGRRIVATVPSSTSITYAVSGAPSSPARGRGVARLPNESDADVVGMLQEQIDWQTANNLTQGMRHLAYPYGFYDEKTIEIASAMGFVTGRTTEVGLNTPITYLTPAVDSLYVAHRLPAIPLHNTQTAAAVLAVVDNAIARGASLCIYGHRIVTSPATSSDFAISEFAALVSGLASRTSAGQVEMLTMTDWAGA